VFYYFHQWVSTINSNIILIVNDNLKKSELKFNALLENLLINFKSVHLRKQRGPELFIIVSYIN
jgi:hypothetical protein